MKWDLFRRVFACMCLPGPQQGRPSPLTFSINRLMWVRLLNAAPRDGRRHRSPEIISFLLTGGNEKGFATRLKRFPGFPRDLTWAIWWREMRFLISRDHARRDRIQNFSSKWSWKYLNRFPSEAHDLVQGGQSVRHTFSWRFRVEITQTIGSATRSVKYQRSNFDPLLHL